MAIPSMNFSTYTPVILTANAPPTADFSACITSLNFNRPKCWNVCTRLMNNIQNIDFVDFLKLVPQFMDEKKIQVRDPLSCERVSLPLKGPLLYMSQLLDGFEMNDPSLKWDVYTEMPGDFRDCHRMGTTYQNQRIELTHMTSVLANDDPEGGLPATITHPKGDNFRLALDHCNRLFRQFSNEQRLPLDVQRSIAELHWWLAQTSPYVGLTPPTEHPLSKDKNEIFIEIVIAAITLHKLGTITPYANHVKPHRLALTMSLEDFVALYPSLRE